MDSPFEIDNEYWEHPEILIILSHVINEESVSWTQSYLYKIANESLLGQ